MSSFIAKRVLNSVVRINIKSIDIRNDYCVNKNLNELIKKQRRVLFNVPSDDVKKINKSIFNLNADSIVLDLEDGVPFDKKGIARNNINEILPSLSKNEEYKKKSNKPELLIRINDTKSKFFNEDLDCVKNNLDYIDGLVLPKIEDFDEFFKVHQFIDDHEQQQRDHKLLASIESAVGMINLRDICTKSSLISNNRLDGLIYASEDLCADMNIIRTDTRKELLYTRSKLVTFARAFNLQAIDLVCIKFRDSELLEIESREGREMGFTGKQAIHPNQIEPIKKAFSPLEEEVDFAKQIVLRFSKLEKEVGGQFPFEINRKVIDIPVVKWAVQLLIENNHDISKIDNNKINVNFVFDYLYSKKCQ
eukprot:TRINITY_DN15780_c0_g1_i1.p1 TRINITY_DN15780_c0_g1~~TRINITY_DN15780_c0_g1_i1.p1  ORF type:complete len:363 (+),score=93.34 TRINITY_DN15780_c0_g1_i1:38-1126(+)